MKNISITFNDLSSEKQADILEMITIDELNKLKSEVDNSEDWKEQIKALYAFETDEDIHNFAEDKANERIINDFKEIFINL